MFFLPAVAEYVVALDWMVAAAAAVDMVTNNVFPKSIN
jgi:hypothetical protein